jgi:tetratricopeptide (TPR) repeat protein
MKTIILLALSILLAKPGFSQETQIDSLKNISIQFLQEGNLKKAQAGFERILELDSLVVDAMFNLGVLNSMLDNHDKAIFFFQKCVKHRDREAAQILKETYKLPIEYSDIMHIEDVDLLPKFTFKGKEYNLLDGNNFHENFFKLMQDAFKNSQIIKRSRFSGTIFLEIEIDKEGNIKSQIMRSSNDLNLDKEIMSKIESLTSLIPARYEEKNVGVYGFRLPLRF